MIPTRRRNSDSVKNLNLKEAADLVGGDLEGDPTVIVTGVAGIKEAEKGDIAFVSNAKYLPFLSETAASAVIVARGVETAASKPLIRVDNPSRAFTTLITHFKPPAEPRLPGIHPTASVDASAKIANGVYVGPNAVIEAGVRIGEGSSIGAGVFIGYSSDLGRETVVYPNVTIREETRIGDRVIIHGGTVIGSDGFGYDTIGGKHVKIPHLGTVEIGDDVEIGANVCIDRGRFQKTVVRRGVKIDNLVQIAHNVEIGEDSLIVSQAGISGSTKLGSKVILAGQAGLVGHIELGDNAVVGAGAGVTKSVPANTVVLGSPAKPMTEQKRLFALIGRLPELFREFAELKKKIEGPK
jgi:UDP-3-O-[3-hydroxymyristoyl] glucosamine N-acyltransferase